jgi:1,4-dihydroxy-2-naphthoyl-CoA synthase
MKQGQADAVAARMADEAGEFIALLRAPEAKEAFAAFFERRKPDFGQFGRGGRS